MSTDLARRATVDDLVSHRTQALSRFAAAMSAAEEATKAAAAAAPTGLPPAASVVLGRHSHGDQSEQFRATLDRAIWTHVLNVMGLRDLMDRQAIDEFERSLDGAPPEATAENIIATVRDKIGEADKIFERGAINAFRRLDRSYASHGGFKIGPRVILPNAISVSAGTWEYHRNTAATVRDIQRVMHVLDGKPVPERGVGCITERISSAVRGGVYLIEDGYFRARVHQNGSVHLWFLRPDLIKRMNLIIARHYGLSLGRGNSKAEGRS